MNMTNDQYFALSRLTKWYNKYQHQFIELSGVIGTGTWDLVQAFIDYSNLDPREVMYLSYNQKQVFELAFKKYHAYYINGVLYKYNRIVNFDSLPVINSNSTELEVKWEKKIRNKIDSKYKLIVVFDSVLLNPQTIEDLSSFGRPIILIRDPMLLPSPDSFTFLREPNIEMTDIHPHYAKSPIVYFAHKIINNEKLIVGNYDTVSVIPKKQMNLYNLKSSDINITITKALAQGINLIYREKILNRKDIGNIANEKIIIMETLYNRKITNPDEKKIKLYLTKGLVGTINRINKHAIGTRYVPMDFKAEFYHELFNDLAIDRHFLNGIEQKSTQIIPDEILKAQYAYALSADMARLSHWDKVALIIDQNEEDSFDLQRRLLYTAITRARHSLNIIF